MQRLLVEGLETGGELALIRIMKPGPSPGSLSGFFDLLTRNRININLSVSRHTERGAELLCCVAPEAGNRMEALFPSEPGQEGHTTVHGNVGVLTLFPHMGDVKMIGLGLLAFAEGGIPLHGFCSSFSTLSFITDPVHVERAFAALRQRFSLPAGPQDCL